MPFGKLGFFTFVEGVYIVSIDLPVKSIRIEEQKIVFRYVNLKSVVSNFPGEYPLDPSKVLDRFSSPAG